jgi:hypothetical protein
MHVSKLGYGIHKNQISLTALHGNLLYQIYPESLQLMDITRKNSLIT